MTFLDMKICTSFSERNQAGIIIFFPRRL